MCHFVFYSCATSYWLNPRNADKYGFFRVSFGCVIRCVTSYWLNPRNADKYGFFVCQGVCRLVCRFCTLALPLCRVLFSLAMPNVPTLLIFNQFSLPQRCIFVIYPIKKILTYCLKLLIIKYSKAMYALFVYILSRFQCLHFCMPNKPLWAWLGYRELQKHFWDWFFVKLNWNRLQRLREWRLLTVVFCFMD